MANIINLSGMVFGDWTVIGRAKNYKHYTMWLCGCKCGKQKSVNGVTLRNGKSRGCGCSRDATNKMRHVTHGATIGRQFTKEYRGWTNAKSRCFNSNNIMFHRYGGRGITMCDRWKNSFENFLIDMGECPNDCTLDRIDGDGNYCPSNCRWSLMIEQQNNKSSNVVVEWNGELMTLMQLSRLTGVSYKYLHKLYRTRGLTLEAAINKCLKNCLPKLARVN